MNWTVMASPTVLVALACATATGTGAAGDMGSAPVVERAAPEQAVDQQGESLVPPGYGTLRQDEATISLRQGALLIKVTPLDEAVIRLLAPDTYTRLHALAQSKANDLGGMAAGSELFLVSFYSYQPDIDFQPEDLQLSYQGRLLRPNRILPLTSAFGRQRLAQQENESAIYVFDGPIDYKQALRVQYDMLHSDEWSRIIPKLQVERAKVRARAGG